MKDQEPAVVFDLERASSYDERFAALAPMRDALHLLIRVILSELPTNAHILCVGAGTGAELIYLAQNFPQWRFTAVEPAAPMLDICRQKVEENGITSRCTFHEGYLDSLPATDAFDAATCLLVSHFMMQQDERSDFFQQIASRLHPDGYLVSSDLAFDMATSEYQSLLEVWLRMLKYAQVPVVEIENFRVSYGRSVALLSPQKVESIITKGGFESPVLFYQTLLIHAWYAKRSA
ncbi:class I SAM-dependent methyltransferase [Chroococcidiopsis sp. CCMEE 29]|uniref:class I SAM-dependent methyltransferase n=1 Tax=Chroococcidiopsis sp. CCMEE 29 TaxID=155894 RepID=UPI002020DD88|nr:class I SAM-dependent methyltransferase [Chroococcidiopsis sp. CCMEE 29]